LFNNAKLPELYKEELTELKNDIPDSYFLIKTRESYSLDGLNPYLWFLPKEWKRGY